MRARAALLAAAMVCGVPGSSKAVEGSSIAGPIGGTDMRSAIVPQPGLYGGAIALYVGAREFADGQGRSIPALAATDLKRRRLGPFLYYVPDLQVLGGSLAFAGIVPVGTECGRLVATTPKRCIAGVGDPYVEAMWSRYFGTLRPSRDPGAFPIPEGLTLAFGLGVVVPIGTYDARDAAQGLTIGDNIWDVSPIVAFTYVSKPILAEGTEISAKFYWNNYLKNPATQYQTGTLLNLDFAITERVGRVQAGFTGFYAFQVADDELFGVPLLPDGRRLELLELGGVLAYDMPSISASLKVKGLTTVVTSNTVKSAIGFAISWYQKLH